ncbi:MAG: hypothetical protein HOC20_01170 [Chloroflexi bacterium]|jgi:hypothetical protein|nr:hypothetical protein [Chloroflexota bacterium]
MPDWNKQATKVLYQLFRHPVDKRMGSPLLQLVEHVVVTEEDLLPGLSQEGESAFLLLALRAPAFLHREIVRIAEREGMSLPQELELLREWVSSLINLVLTD